MCRLLVSKLATFSVTRLEVLWYDYNMRYFTSDLHLGSALINKYAHRPFSSAEDAMLAHIIAINETCNPSDILIHVGDFMLDGADRHGKTEDIGMEYSQEDYLAKMNVRVVLLAGNHDDGHNCDADCKSLVLDLNQNYRNVYVSHFPSDNTNYHGPYCICKAKTKVVLCGHVHDSWLLKYDAYKNVLNVNVGTDVWHYKPVRDAQITEMLDYVFKHHTFDWSWQQTRADFDGWKKLTDLAVAAKREQRKAEKHKKKGLTPEICQQRKEEALRKKGLLK